MKILLGGCKSTQIRIIFWGGKKELEKKICQKEESKKYMTSVNILKFILLDFYNSICI